MTQSIFIVDSVDKCGRIDPKQEQSRVCLPTWESWINYRQNWVSENMRKWSRPTTTLFIDTQETLQTVQIRDDVSGTPILGIVVREIPMYGIA